MEIKLYRSGSICFTKNSWFPASTQGELPADFELLAAKVKVKLGVLWGDAFTIVSQMGNQMVKQAV